MQLEFRKGTLLDTEQLLRFLEEVRDAMPCRDWFYLDPPDTVRDMMADGTMELWVAMEGGRMAAAFTVLHPGTASFNYGYDLGLSQEELLQVVHMDTAAVHRDYRGRGLQRKMVDATEKALAGQGRRILLCTVHPDNRYSLDNMQKQGYEIQKRLAKYGTERFVLRKDIF